MVCVSALAAYVSKSGVNIVGGNGKGCIYPMFCLFVVTNFRHVVAAILAPLYLKHFFRLSKCFRQALLSVLLSWAAVLCSVQTAR